MTKTRTKKPEIEGEVRSTWPLIKYYVRLDGEDRDRCETIKAIHASSAAEKFGQLMCEENDCDWVTVVVTLGVDRELTFGVQRTVVYQACLIG